MMSGVGAPHRSMQQPSHARFLRSSQPRRCGPAHRQHQCRSSGKDDDEPTPGPSGNQLEAVIRRKQRQVAAALEELGLEGLDARLQLATESPAQPSHRLARVIAEVVPTGRPALVVELARGGPAQSPAALAAAAARWAAAGADALAVPTDAEATPEGQADLFAVCRAVPRTPVLARDWLLHPLQVAEAKEAGAAGALGAVASVTGRGTAILSGFAAAAGLDCPVEVVNLKELKEMEGLGVPFYGLNLAVGLSVSIPGFGADIAKGLLGELPFGVASLVGVRSIEEAQQARLAGADALLIKRELAEACPPGGEAALVAALRDATCGDD